ncbi:MAG: molybdate ABC transporter substrate-binding protein [Myxococcota bacterium]
MLALLLSACKPSAAPQAPPPLTVAAAADLALAFEELGKLYTAETHTPVRFSFGSTGLLAKQIAEGGPFDVFAAANVSFVDQVVASGRCDGASKTPYAFGRIVLWSKDPSMIPARIEDLADEKYRRVALANPEHAPYGLAAKQALEKAGVWEAVKPRLVYGENVRQALQFAETGNAEVALVALSLTASSSVAKGGSLVDAALHAPIEQAMAICGTDATRQLQARRFLEMVRSEPGRAIMRRYGFFLPGERPATELGAAR